MKKYPNSVVFAIIVLLSWCHPTPATSDASEISQAQSRLRFSELRTMPSMPVYGSAGLAYWRIVRSGLAVVPDLVTLVADSSPTGIPTPYRDGEYRNGDIAVLLLQEILPDLPVASLVQDEGGQDRRLGKYWEFVGESDENRLLLRHRINTWLAANKAKLEWSPARHHPAAGWFRIVNRKH